MFFIKRHTPETKCSGRIYDRVNVLPINLTTSFVSLAFDLVMHAAKNVCLFFYRFQREAQTLQDG